MLIGEGNGRFLAECLRRKVGGSITVVDLSRNMLSLLYSRVKHIERRTELNLVQVDFRAWDGQRQVFDGIVTHFFLDLFKPDSQLTIVRAIGALSHTGTLWANVDYRPTLESPWHRCIDWLQYRFDHLVSGVEADHHYDPSSLIHAAGWIVRDERLFRGGSVVAQLFGRSPARYDEVFREL